MAWTKMKTAIVTGVVVLLAAGTTTVTVKEIHAHHPPMTPETFQKESAARLYQSKSWALAFIMYAQRHQNQLPTDFKEVNNASGAKNLAASDWEIVSSGTWTSFTNFPNTILLREKKPRQSPDGNYFRAYAFADGHAQIVKSPTEDFDSVEKDHGFVIEKAK